MPKHVYKPCFMFFFFILSNKNPKESGKKTFLTGEEALLIQQAHFRRDIQFPRLWNNIKKVTF